MGDALYTHAPDALAAGHAMYRGPFLAASKRPCVQEREEDMAMCAACTHPISPSAVEQGRASILSADAMSTITDYSDRGNAILWGDGAGAVILKASQEPGILSTHIHAQGKYEDLLHVPRKSDEKKDTIDMVGNQVFKIAVNTLDRIVDETLDANNLKKTDIDWLVPHQANIRILEATAKKLSMGMDKVIVTIDRHGNTSAASIPLALDEGIKTKKILPNQLILMEAFGGGFTWGSALIKL